MSGNIIVIGAGVSGLTTAAVLLERGYDVTIWAREVSPHTTSDRAGAIWYPYLSGPADKVTHWCAESIRRFYELEGDGASGVVPVNATMLFRAPQAAPAWHELLRDFTNAPEPTFDGYEWKQGFSVPFIDTTVYMPYLARFVRDRGGVVEQRTVAGFEQALQECRTVVNCTGLGARGLCGDETVYPVRGQTVRLRKDGIDLRDAIIDDEHADSLAYIFPRSTDILCGGTSQAGDANMEASPDDTEAILERCRKLVPALETQEVLGVSVGLRPARPSVRVDGERRDDGWVVHNYGHGGSGFTLSWGCAAEAADIVSQVAG